MSYYIIPRTPPPHPAPDHNHEIQSLAAKQEDDTPRSRTPPPQPAPAYNHEIQPFAQKQEDDTPRPRTPPPHLTTITKYNHLHKNKRMTHP